MEREFAPPEGCRPSRRIIVAVNAYPSGLVGLNTQVQLQGIAHIEIILGDCSETTTSLAFSWALTFQAPNSGPVDITSSLNGRNTLTPNFVVSSYGTYQAVLWAGFTTAQAVITTGGVQGLPVLGYEVNQGLPGYELVAGKDTLVRIFVGAISATQPASLDFASLRVQGPQGIDFQIEAMLSSGRFTNTAQSFSERDNINFYVGGDQLAKVGQYTFTASFYRSGQLVGMLNLGAATFFPTKDLRILVVVDNWPLSVPGWNAVHNALLHISRNYPIRCGVGPVDNDLSLGLRYALNPLPIPETFNQGWPSPRQALQDFNSRQAQLGKPDRADRVFIVRDQQPGEPPLGGAADFPGVVLGAVYILGSNFFTTIVCQELGHTFGIDHSSNATIANPSAFDLLQRRSIPNPVPFMHNPVGPDDAALFEIQNWNTVRNGLLALSSTGP